MRDAGDFVRVSFLAMAREISEDLAALSDSASVEKHLTDEVQNLLEGWAVALPVEERDGGYWIYSTFLERLFAQRIGHSRFSEQKSFAKGGQDEALFQSSVIPFVRYF